MSKKIVMIIAFNGFRDEEYIEPKKILEKAGIEIMTASTQAGTATGKLGAAAKIDIPLDKLKVSEYDGVVFVGGPGSYAYHEDPLAQKIAREAVKLGKVVGGICAGAGILANAGILKGKTATCFSGIKPMLMDAGANYTGKGLEVDGKIVTADGPAHARQFGEAIEKNL